MKDLDLTQEELASIRSLKRLAKKWPKSLWLFSGSGSLWVMKYKSDGSPGMTPSGGVDPDFSVDVIAGIPNDGGDW